MTSCGSPVGSHSRPNFHGGGGGGKGHPQMGRAGTKGWSNYEEGSLYASGEAGGLGFGPQWPTCSF